ncbi:glycosyltransferase family 4 protein [Odoribacter lunatus]|uniref:glycosyltransferase family 4 protein n=1 Tax=Odoribacter lunatus TaxID=2941335 RepID=UPI00203B68B4|nr:MraY family glycosyltransferase [Odoribacter lunatus]
MQIFKEYNWLLPIITFLLAFWATSWIHPKMIKLAFRSDIMDKPNCRKLQKKPVPVLGGLAVFFGLSGGLVCVSLCGNCSYIVLAYVFMALMLYIGTFDDIMQLSSYMRLFIEIACIGVFVLIAGGIDNFYGLWHIGRIPYWLEFVITIFASVGIINAINLIDGVDGLSSGYCVMASIVFGVFFFLSGDWEMLILAAASIGALVPFFFHNVFGKSSKMFIGDGGTLVMGIIMAVFVIRILNEHQAVVMFADAGMGLIPFTLAVLSIPVFDTLRVMIARMLKGNSPFHPDKTHLHHLFINEGFSHIGTTFCIISLNTVVILVWWLLYHWGVSVDLQLYVVVLLGLLFTVGLYFGTKILSRSNRMKKFIRRLALLSHISRKGFILKFQNWLDGK